MMHINLMCFPPCCLIKSIEMCIRDRIFNAVGKLLKKAVVDKPTLVICVLVILGSALTDLSPIVFVIFAAVVGIILKNKEVASK